MFTRRIMMLMLVLVAGATVSACSWSAEHNEDGSWTVTGNITETQMQDEIDAALADPLISNVQADFHDGYVSVSADRQTLDGSQTQLMTFRVALSVVNDHLGLVISDVQLDGVPVEEASVDVWNVRLANRLERAGQRRPDSTLQSVTVSEDDLTMVWRVESRR